MSTRILLAAVVAALAVPWIISAGSPGSVGMYADPRHVLFQGDSDVYDCIWHFRWIQDAADRGLDPRVYHGRTLAWNNMAWPDLFLASLFGWGYDFSLMAGALFTALAGYVLARSWGLGRNGSILAAFIMVWMPVRTIRMYQHYPVASTGYVLMALAMVRRTIQSPGKLNLVTGFVFAALAAAESLQHGLTLAVGWLITVLFTRKKSLKGTALSAIVPGAGCIAGALWLFTSPGLTGTDPGKDWREAVFWGAEIQSYFLPALFGRPVMTGYMPNPFEGVVTPGLTVIVLALAWCVKNRRWKAAAAAFCVMVLSVGPLFKFLGVPTPVPLPYMIVAKTPWLSAARAPARLGIAVGFMAALGAGAFIEKRGRAAGWILTCLVMLEITPFVLRKIDTRVPSYYTGSPEVSLRLEIPASDEIRRYSLFEAADGVPRRVKFFARGGEDMMVGIPPGLCWNPAETPRREDFQATGASEIIYDRWIFPGETRALYDSLYGDIFTDEEKGDSIWVWRSNENGS